MENPFELIIRKLNNIEELLMDIKHAEGGTLREWNSRRKLIEHKEHILNTRFEMIEVSFFSLSTRAYSALKLNNCNTFAEMLERFPTGKELKQLHGVGQSTVNEITKIMFALDIVF